MYSQFVPSDASVLPLAPNSKIPLPGSHGHHDARLKAEVNVDALLEQGNYGIVLDNKFLVVDFDTHSEHEWLGKLPKTWTQLTRRGRHFLYRVGPGVQGRNRRFDGGDVKIRGYIVGPGSVIGGTVYAPERTPEGQPLDVFQAPQWLVDYVSQGAPSPDAQSGEGVDAIGEGERDNSLVRVAGTLRRIGLSEGAITKALGAVNSTLVVPPLDESDIQRIARSAGKWAVGAKQQGLTHREDAWECAQVLDYAGPPIRWWIRGFIPRGELVMMYGKGGSGKSTWGSWLAAHITQRDGRFAFAGVEEPFKRFAWRAILGGARPDGLVGVTHPTAIQLPRDAEWLAERIVEYNIDVLYFDSIYSHFEAVDGLNAAERARRCLAPLAEIAQETGTSLIGVFHTNKGGQFLGSVEMENVGRVLLRFSREEGRSAYVMVEKTNFRPPEYFLTYGGKEVAMADIHTGEVQLEEQDDGSITPATMFVAERLEDVPRATVNVDDLEDQTPSTREQVEALLEKDDNLSTSEIAELLGLPRTTVSYHTAALKKAA